jgi:hypothetical protein
MKCSYCGGPCPGLPDYDEDMCPGYEDEMDGFSEADRASAPIPEDVPQDEVDLPWNNPNIVAHPFRHVRWH